MSLLVLLFSFTSMIFFGLFILAHLFFPFFFFILVVCYFYCCFCSCFVVLLVFFLFVLLCSSSCCIFFIFLFLFYVFLFFVFAVLFRLYFSPVTFFSSLLKLLNLSIHLKMFLFFFFCLTILLYLFLLFPFFFLYFFWGGSFIFFVLTLFTLQTDFSSFFFSLAVFFVWGGMGGARLAFSLVSQHSFSRHVISSPSLQSFSPNDVVFNLVSLSN